MPPKVFAALGGAALLVGAVSLYLFLGESGQPKRESESPRFEDALCSAEIPFRPSILPRRFSDDPVPGPAPGGPPAEPGQVVIHYTDGAGRAVEIRRPGTLFTELTGADDDPMIYVLGELTSPPAPTQPRGDDFIVQLTFPPDSEPEDRCAHYSLNEYDLRETELVHLALGLVPRGGPDTGRTFGAFDFCPSPVGVLAPGIKARSDAKSAALAFITAVLEEENVAVERLADPAWFRNDYSLCCRGVRVFGGVPASRDGLVGISCGEEIERLSWRVTIDVGESASLDGWLYLVRRQDGWRVWGYY